MPDVVVEFFGLRVMLEGKVADVQQAHTKALDLPDFSVLVGSGVRDLFDATDVKREPCHAQMHENN